jgi:hypothetical protein
MKTNDRRIVLANKLLKDKSIGVDDICTTLKTTSIKETGTTSNTFLAATIAVCANGHMSCAV